MWACKVEDTVSSLFLFIFLMGVEFVGGSIGIIYKRFFPRSPHFLCPTGSSCGLVKLRTQFQACFYLFIFMEVEFVRGSIGIIYKRFFPCSPHSFCPTGRSCGLAKMMTQFQIYLFVLFCSLKVP